MRLVYAGGARRRQHAESPTSKADRERFCLDRCRGARARRIGHPHRGSLLAARRACRPRWTSNGRRTARTASSTSSRRGPKRSHPQRVTGAFETYALKTGGPVLVDRTRGRREDRLRHGPRGDRCARPCRLPPGRSAGGRGDEPRLGAGHEDCRRDRHQPGRAHLPRRDCRPRARRACGGRRRRGDRKASDRDGRHRQLRRGRSRQGL